MTAAAHWSLLGIEPVSDRNAIRRAYARQLKRIDPEADPHAFIALREAMECATDWARWQDDDRGEPTDSFDTFPIDTRPQPEASAVDLTKGPAGPWSNGSEAGGGQKPAPRVDEHALRALDDLLFGGEADQVPDPRALAAAVRRILNDPAMDSVDQANWIEHWMAEVIASSIPRSDAVVTLVCQHFGWDREDARWDQNWDIHYVHQRHLGLSLLDRLADERHGWHRAYLSLISTEGDFSHTDWRERGNVRDLLQFIRSKAPEAEGGLDPCRVALWEDGLFGPRQEEGYKPDYQPSGGYGSRWIWIMIGLMLIKVFAILAAGV